GGVDMPALWRPLRASLKGGRKAKAELARAERALAGLRRERLRLAEQEQRLGQDEAARAALARTAARGASVSTARALADALDDMAAADERLRELPPELAELRPSDPEDVAKVAAELSDALAEVEEKGRRLRDAERVARDDRLPSTLTLAEAKERSALAEELRRWEEDAASLAAEVDGAKAALDQAWRAMGGVPGHAGAAGIDRATIDGAAAAVFELQAADLEEDQLARRLREVEAAGEDESPEAEDVDALRRAAHELARWLELPPPVGRLPGWGWALSLGLAAGAVAAAFLLPRPWPEASAALMLAWLLAAFAVSRRPRAPARDAAEPALRRALGAAGLELPPAATHEAAAELLAVVVDSVSREERRREEREERAARFAQLQDDLAAARRRRQAAVQRLAALRDEHGFGARGDAGFVQWLALAREHALLLVRLSDLEGRLERRTARCARARRDLLAYLSGAGEVVPEDVVAAVLVERCRRLCDAVADRDAAAERARTLAQEIARARAEAAGAARRLEAIARRGGLRPPRRLRTPRRPGRRRRWRACGGTSRASPGCCRGTRRHNGSGPRRPRPRTTAAAAWSTTPSYWPRPRPATAPRSRASPRRLRRPTSRRRSWANASAPSRSRSGRRARSGRWSERRRTRGAPATPWRRTARRAWSRPRPRSSSATWRTSTRPSPNRPRWSAPGSGSRA